MFALLLLVHNAAGKDTQKDVPTIQPIVSCPDVGYYFKRDVNPNSIGPGPCNLCFCQDNSTAVCWPRDSSRCDPKRYSYYGKRKRENREKRSPAFTDIFFRDAAREVFHRQSPEQCKPYESSFSEGCPPADWCIGCTVCDCDANGRWDCHILSFCPDIGDGIDILIEAIKNAPDIKSVHKVVFHNDTVETNENVVATTETRLAATFYNVNKNMEKIHFQQVNDSVKEFDSMDADEGYADIYDNKTYHPKELKVNRFFDIEITEKVIDTTMGPKVYVANNDEEKINIILDRYDTDKGDDKRGFEVFTDDTDEEGPIISSSRAPEVETEMDIEAVTHKMPKRTTMPPQVTETSEKHSVPDAKSDKQANLDWTDLENSSREEERRDVVERKRSTTQTPTQLATRTLKKAAHKYPEPTSSSSREDEEAQAKTVNPEYLMRKKQLNLLNSLDYETEKSVIDAESKEDKYNSEVFSFM
ncbi:hypothetical protein KGM_213367 [Danaus plexippus plexippus]|uniref:Uncharacterized protein n=1 Tax=Danaus plexippus plexippus TaxID=278856 RepID=A0A212F291_DANPL|nr:hypothetical protein KGM_213367 [Danaus plexippus plexippus]